MTKLVPVLCIKCRDKIMVPEESLEDPDGEPAKCVMCRESKGDEEKRKSQTCGGGTWRNPHKGKVAGG